MDRSREHLLSGQTTAFNLKADSEKCTGCRACEAACSYHHGKVFSLKVASLWVHRMDREGRIHITLYEDLPEKIKKKRFPCDQCIGEPEPLCVKYCVVDAMILT